MEVFGPCTTQNHLNSWVVQEIPAEWLPLCFKTNRPAGAIGWDCRASVGNYCQVLDMSPRVDIPSTCKVGQKVSLPLLTCWHASLWRDHPGYCTADVGNPRGTYELPCNLYLHEIKWQNSFLVIHVKTIPISEGGVAYHDVGREAAERSQSLTDVSNLTVQHILPTHSVGTKHKF
jgi:hypothetical protein